MFCLLCFTRVLEFHLSYVLWEIIISVSSDYLAFPKFCSVAQNSTSCGKTWAL